MELKPAYFSLFILAALAISQPSNALTPLRSPEQLAADDLLYSSAGKLIAPKVIRCFNVAADDSWKPFTLRFFLAGSGKKPQQFEIVKNNRPAHFASSPAELAAVKAVSACAPYPIPAELSSWGGFWVEINFEPAF